MIYTQSQRCIATILLFSLLLQSCGNPNWKIADHASPRGASTQTYHPAKVKQRSASSALAKVEGTSALGGEALSTSSTEALAEVSSTAPSSPVQSAVLPTLPQHLYASSPSSRPSTKQEKSVSATSSDNKPRHAVLGQDAIARRKGTPPATSRAVVPVVVATPTQPQALQPLHAEKLHPVFSRQPQPKVQHAIKTTEREALHLKPAISLALQPYPSAQGHQVCFQEANGKWLAQVQDVWGRAQLLPVVCAPDQTPTQALQKLAKKATGQHKYWVHVLATNQTPWAPRVVYVGALGVRGGGNSSSSDHGPSDRGDRGSRRERNDLSTNRSTSVDLFTVGIGSSPQISIGRSANYSDSLAASRVVNEGIRRSNEIFGSSGSSVFNAPCISETPSFTTQGSGAISSLRIVRDSERRVESMIRSTSQKMDMIQLTHNPDPVERRMASMRLSSGLQRGNIMGDRTVNAATRRMHANIFSGSNATPSSASAPAPSASKASGAVVSSGFVLDSKGQLRPHDVRVPFIPPANYYEAHSVVIPATQDVRNMDISELGLECIAKYEGFRAHTYKVGGRGNDTIGYGHEVLKGEDFSQGVTHEQALQLLKQDAQEALTKVQKAVTVPLKQHQLDALVSYVYNTGGLDGTRLLKKLNAGNFEGAAQEMDIVTQKGTGGKVLPGLQRRRKDEQKLFLYGYDD